MDAEETNRRLIKAKDRSRMKLKHPEAYLRLKDHLERASGLLYNSELTVPGGEQEV
ncbi:TraY domain-containing protein [Klebsiella pneumoniae]